MSENLPIKLERCRITHNSLEMDEAATYEDWLAVGAGLKNCTDSIQWLVGDWINEGRRKHEHRYGAALQILCEDGDGFDPNTIYRWGRVAQQFEVRHRSLNWTLHYLLCDTFLSDSKRAELLKAATDGKWTKQQLKDEIKAATKVADNPTECDQNGL
jgi:hypothetical protein